MKKFILLVASLFALGAWADSPTSTFKMPTFKESKVVHKLLSKRAKRQLRALKQAQLKQPVDINDYNIPDSDDLDIHGAYANPRITDPEYTDIATRVANRLKLARERAVQRHQELWCNGGVV